MAHRSLLYLVYTFSLVSPQVPKYVLKGQEINLVPSISGQPDGILWTRDGKKVVDFNGMEEFVFPPYENRITLDWASAELAIKDARYQDSGQYELEVKIHKRVHRSAYEWEVIDKVGKPSISCEMANENQATLVCSTHSKHPRLVQFMWRSRGKKQLGPNLTITLQDKLDVQIYRCDVSNPLSNKTAAFTAKDCFLDKKSATLLAIILPVIFAVAFMLLIILGCLFRRKLQGTACFEDTKKGVCKRRRSTTEGDETTSFLEGLSTLPSNQRLRSLLPSDWIDSAYGNEDKPDARNGYNKELTENEAVDSALATSSDLPNSQSTSSGMSTPTEQEGNSPQQILGDTSEGIVHEGDSPQVETLSSNSAEEEHTEAKEGGATPREPILNLATRGSNQGDETTFFLEGLSTLPSNQRLGPLLPSDWIDSEDKPDATNGYNKELTENEAVDSALATFSDLPNSQSTSSGMSTPTEQEGNSPQQILGDTSEGIVHEGDSPQVETLSSNSAEEEHTEEKEGGATPREPILNLATRGSNQGDETTFFLEGLSTLPSNQRLGPLLPSDWIDSEDKPDATNGYNKELTENEAVDSALATFSDLPNSQSTSSGMRTPTEQEGNSPQQILGDTSEGIVHEGDSPQVETLSSNSAEEEHTETKEGGATPREPILNLATRVQECIILTQRSAGLQITQNPNEDQHYKKWMDFSMLG
ncbi:uncharacterized protein LOC144087431 [Stigmatopora argus]